ncbi:MAG: hypothetical protein J1E85_09545 [Ruminococcus sp.]|nr:hypothetical protein [Ruminococcus sp.]
MIFANLYDKIHTMNVGASVFCDGTFCIVLCWSGRKTSVICDFIFCKQYFESVLFADTEKKN